MFRRQFNDRGELPVLLILKADISRIDPVFVERFGAGRMIGEQFMADIMKIANQGHRHPHLGEAVANMGPRSGGFVTVHCDANQFRTGAGQSGHLPCRAFNIGCVGVGHALDDNWGMATNLDAAHIDGLGHQAGLGRGFNECLCKIGHSVFPGFTT